MKKLPIVLVICSLLILMVGCSASPSPEESGPSSAVPSDPSGSEASAEPDITSSRGLHSTLNRRKDRPTNE